MAPVRRQISSWRVWHYLPIGGTRTDSSKFDNIFFARRGEYAEMVISGVRVQASRTQSSGVPTRTAS